MTLKDLAMKAGKRTHPLSSSERARIWFDVDKVTGRTKRTLVYVRSWTGHIDCFQSDLPVDVVDGKMIFLFD